MLAAVAGSKPKDNTCEHWIPRSLLNFRGAYEDKELFVAIGSNEIMVVIESLNHDRIGLHFFECDCGRTQRAVPSPERFIGPSAY